jgi:hypothetical protein
VEFSDRFNEQAVRLNWSPELWGGSLGSGQLVVTSTTGFGIRLSLAIESTCAIDSVALSRWLKRYWLSKTGEGLDLPEFTFRYVLFGYGHLLPPDGSVDGVGVIEAGLGGELLGPADGAPVPADRLFERAFQFFD